MYFVIHSNTFFEQIELVRGSLYITSLPSVSHFFLLVLTIVLV